MGKREVKLLRCGVKYGPTRDKCGLWCEVEMAKVLWYIYVYLFFNFQLICHMANFDYATCHNLRSYQMKVYKVSCDQQIEGHANQFGCSEINEGMVTSSPSPLSVVVIHM